MRISSILCPTDLSGASAHAIDHAVALARHYSASITALHVVGPLAPPAADTMETLEQRTRMLFHSAAEHHLRLDVLIDTGSPVRRILDWASHLPADLIVMGTHGASGFRHLVLGSVTETMLRHAECPVLTVPPGVAGPPRMPFQRVLCAVDHSDASEITLRTAASMARESGAALTLLQVIEWPWHEPPAPSINALPPEQGAALAAFRRDAEESATRRLDALVAGLESPAPIGIRIVSGTPSEQILRLAAAEDVDLIVVGPGRRNVLDLAFLGSTTNHVVREATCPVLTVCPPSRAKPADGQRGAHDSRHHENC